MKSKKIPLYNHSLPEIEEWLSSQGCQQNPKLLNSWTVSRPDWTAEICLEEAELMVRYIGSGERGLDVQRTFPYSLSREDLEDAVFAGP